MSEELRLKTEQLTRERDDYFLRMVSHWADVQTLRDILAQAVESSGFRLAGPTDSRAAEHGEPAWVCNARGAIAEVDALNR